MGAVQVLIFSHSVRMLRIIREVITRRGYVFSWLDGSTPVKDRQGLCDVFNRSPAQFIFLISTTAGGLGINLTSANKCVGLPLLPAGRLCVCKTGGEGPQIAGHLCLRIAAHMWERGGLGHAGRMGVREGATGAEYVHVLQWEHN